MTVELRTAPYAGWRALAATVLVMSGAVAAHTWAGGHVPAWPGLVLLGAVVWGTSRLLLTGRLTRRVLLPAVVAAQACLHTSLVALSGPMAGHEAHSEMTGGPSPWSGRMLLAHATVTLLTLLVWRLCERAAHAVVRLLARPLPYALARPVRRPARTRPLVATPGALLLAAPRRGPPVALSHA